MPSTTRGRRTVAAAPTPWRVEATVPYDSSAWSKNRVHRVTTTRDGRAVLYTRAEARQVREQLAMVLLNVLHRANVRPVKAKLWLHVVVWRANMRGDPINALDLVADATKDAFKALAQATMTIPLDDNWFAARLDWGLDPEYPHLDIALSQGGV